MATLVLLALALLAGCSSDEGAGILGAGGHSEGEPSAASPLAAPPGVTPEERRAAHIAAVQRNAESEYDFDRVPGSNRAVARTLRQGLTAELSDGTLRVDRASPTLGWSLGLRWSGIGRGNEIRHVESPAAVVATDCNRALYHRSDGSVEWYLNGPLGVEQGFFVPERPSGQGMLVLQLQVSGLRPDVAADGTTVALEDNHGKTRVVYRDLFAADANGKPLRAHLLAASQAIALRIDDSAATYPIDIDPLIMGQATKLLAPNGAPDDEFGSSVGISGVFAIVGNPNDDDNGTESGSAHVFERDGGGTWNHAQKLLASDGSEYDYFGCSVDISGDRAVVGAWNSWGSANISGAAYVFEREGGGNWTERAKLTASDGVSSDAFGFAVGISGRFAVVGAYQHGSDGAAYWFERDGVGAWQQVDKATTGVFHDFGRAVGISGTYAIVGGPGSFTTSGAIVYERDVAGAWQPRPPIGGGESSGHSVDISGSYAIIGDIDYEVVGLPTIRTGSALIYERDGSGNWNSTPRLFASDRAHNDEFGNSVGIAGKFAIVGAHLEDGSGNDGGGAYLFERDPSGAWNQTQKLLASDGAASDDFGSSVDISGDFGIIGARLDDDSGSSSGAAYVFEQCFGQPDGATCSDGVFCNGLDNCQGGACVGHEGDPCAQNVGDPDADCSESCDENATACTAADPDDSACDDGSFCNGAESCTSGTCTNSSGDPCPGPDGDGDCSETCDEGADSCTADDPNGSGCNDGETCNGTETCSGGICGNSSGNLADDTPCNDSVFCNGTDTCQSGSCAGHAGDPCAANLGDADADCSEACDESADDCVATDADGSSCSDGSFCNGTETCTGGVCGNSTGDPCAAYLGDADSDCSESCDETDDSCTANDVDGSGCDDGTFCNGADSCAGGACITHSGDPCASNLGDADSDCSESCNEATKACTSPDPDGSSCDDGAFCNGTETCSDGTCANSTGDPCLLNVGDADSDCSESCDEATDSCSANDPDTSACDDATFCNGADQCAGGSCSTHEGDPCPGADGDSDCSETCNETAGGCVGNDPDGAACEEGGTCVGGQCTSDAGLPNGDPCTSADECEASYCTDGVCCTSDDCSPFRCGDNGDCIVICSSTANCQPGYACSSDGRCIDASAADDGADDGGCSCRMPGRAPRRTRSSLLALVGLGLLTARRRRCPAPRSSPSPGQGHRATARAGRG